MIVRCPECGSRYRFDEGRVGGGSAPLKCPRCGHRFTVEIPSPGADEAAAASRTALLADQARGLRDEVQKALEEEGYEVSVTDSGEEALLLAANHRFDLILLGVYLRRLPGTQVCEKIKRSPELRSIPVMLLGAPLTSEGGPSESASVFGADEFLPTRLGREELRRRIRLTGGHSTPPPASTEAFPADPRHPRPSAAPEKASSGGPLAAEESEIRRLARIMISDIQMYHPEKFGRALREGTFFEAFAEELGKGKEIIDQRFAHLANRIPLLAAGIRDTLEELRPSRRRSAAGE